MRATFRNSIIKVSVMTGEAERSSNGNVRRRAQITKRAIDIRSAWYWQSFKKYYQK